MTTGAELETPASRLQQVSDWVSFEALRREVTQDLKTYEAFASRVKEYRADRSQLAASAADAALALGVCDAALGRCEAAIAALSAARDCGLKHYLLGRAHHGVGRHGEAVACYERAAAAGWETRLCELSKAEAYLAAGKVAEAGAIIDARARNKPSEGLWHYLKGWHLSLTGRTEAAIETLRQAIELSPNCQRALFRLAYTLDLVGDEEEAVTLYERCNKTPPVHVNALINLASIFEDNGEYDAAEDCLSQILETHPNHYRARAFLKDVQSSRSMFYDEEQERVREKHGALLDISVSDFELSVRSRNCLKKMNIHTLGDLLRTTEQELLAYKNFGETSLNEIRAMLAQKGLTLGQGVEGEAIPPAWAAKSGAPPGVPAAVLNKPVAELELSVRSRKCLQRLNIATLGELAARTEAELLGIENFGQTSLAEVKRRLAENGLSLRQLED